MPCDTKKELIENTNSSFIWKSIESLHKPYWEYVAGDIDNFYILRGKWYEAFVSKINCEYSYRRDKNINIISKEVAI